ncbi:hypothetical protein [Rhizobium sp. L1K21]|uniref:hypothetical protein n=1 Tax=Rhizobium sp. L1K21 TaxID=2954933 RepID=UPI002093D0FE|nr:hypothetical protein [Rhizobium sp. L1K21]MCO6185470.1 hypothetical protein [Rhizobium sp. L1K21]
MIQKLIAPLLIAAMATACSTSETLTPPADIGSSSAPDTAQQFPASQPMQQTSMDESQFPAAPEQQEQPIDQQPQNTSPVLGTPGGISATNRSIFQAPAGQAATVSGSIRFLPVIGAPIEAVTPLSQQLGTAARARGLTLKSSSDNSADHMLKGYFSAFADGGMTTIVYVWDILDGAGTRLHRIQGQEKVSGTSADNWSIVPATTMQKIANETISAYIAWRQNAGG